MTAVVSGVLVMNSEEAFGVTPVFTIGSVVGINVGLTVAMVLMLGMTVLS